MKWRKTLNKLLGSKEDGNKPDTDSISNGSKAESLVIIDETLSSEKGKTKAHHQFSELFDKGILKKYRESFSTYPSQIDAKIHPQLKNSNLYQLGWDEGYALIENTEPTISMIESFYDFVIETIDQDLQRAQAEERERANAKIEQLNEALETVEKKLNPQEEDSIYAQAKRKISVLENQVDALFSKLEHTQFIDEHREAWSKYIGMELDLINQTYREGQLQQEALTAETDRLRQVIVDGLKFKDNGAFAHEDVQELKNILKEFPIIDNSFGKSEKGRQGPSFSQRYALKLNDIENALENLRNTVLHNQPFISGPWAPRIYYFLSFVIFFGEFYLVYNFLAELLGFQTGREISLNSVTWPTFLFALAYPLGIGMLFKFAIAHAKDQIKFKRLLYTRFGIGMILTSLFLISIPNTIKILSEDDSFFSNEAINTLNQLAASPGIISLEIVGVMIFLFTLTILLAVVGASLLTEAMKMSNQRYHLRGGLLKDLKKNSIYSNLTRKIDKEEAKIRALEQQKEKILKEKAEYESRHRSNTPPISLAPSKEEVKKTAINIYRSGYEGGKSKRLMEMPADQYIIYKLKVGFSNSEKP